MRMKDSDDYITARAANPWTGLVSPSVGSPSPCTPNLPADALELSVIPVRSQKPDNHTRPTLSRTNEFANVKNATNQHSPYKNSWIQANHPPGSFVQDVVAANTPLNLKDDQFVVHMPSAREPQPYGISRSHPQEIQALESRRMNVLHASKNARSTTVAGGACIESWNQHMDGPGLASPVDISNARRNVPAAKTDQNRRDMLGQNLGETRLLEVSNNSQPRTRFKSPMEPGRGNAATLDMHAAVTRDMQLGKMSVHHAAVPRPSINSNLTIPRDSNGPDSTDCYLFKTHERNSRRTPRLVSDLNQLPKVMLVHPDLAGLPRATLLRSKQTFPGHDTKEAGTFGDAGSSDSFNEPKNNMKCPPPWSVADNMPIVANKDGSLVQGIGPKTDTLLELLLGLSSFVYDMSLRIFGRMPHVSCFEALTSPTSTKQQKFVALKTLMSLIGQILAIFTAATLLWQVASVLLGFLELLMLPIKIFVWLASG